MKNLILTYLLAFCILLLSCEKEAITEPREYTPLSAEDYLSRHVKNDVIFQYLLISESTGNTNGWAITKYGDVRLLSGTVGQFSFDFEEVSQDYLEAMIINSKKLIGTVNTQDLLRYYKINQTLGRSSIDSEKVNPNGNYMEVFSSFIPASAEAKGESGSRSCQEGYYNSDEKINTYLAIPLESKGEFLSVNTHHNSRPILDWLKSLEFEIEIPD